MPSYPAISPDSLSTIVSAAGSNVQEQKWMAKAIIRQKAAGQFAKITGGAFSGRPVLQVVDTEKNQGQTINMKIVAPLGGPGVQGSSSDRTGTGESQKAKMMTLTVGNLFKAKKWNNIAMSQCVLGSTNDQISRNQLADWHGRRMSDCHEALMLANRHARNTVYSNRKTSIASLVSADTFRAEDVTRAKNALLGLGGFPFDVAAKGKAPLHRFFAALNNRITEDMELSGEWQALLKDAQPRGDMNPLFTGAMPDWMGNIFQRWEIVNDDSWGPKGALAAPVAYLGEAVAAAPATGYAMKGGGSATGAALTDPKYFEYFPAAAFTGYQDTAIIAAETGTEYYALIQHISGADVGKFSLVAYQVNSGNQITLTKVLRSATSGGTIKQTTVGSATWGSGVYTSTYFSDGEAPIGSPVWPCNAKGQPYCFGYVLGSEAIACGYGRGIGGTVFGRRTQEEQQHGRDTEIGMDIVWGCAPMVNADNVVSNYAVIVSAWNPDGLPDIT